MREGWVEVPLGSVVRQVRRPAAVQKGEEYQLLGVRWYGGGPFAREIAVGGVMKATRVFSVEEGDFIYNRLFAWKGSFGLVGHDLSGSFVSGEFPLFRTDPKQLLPEYLNLVMCQPATWVQIERESTGSTSTSRNRWKEERFFEWPILLPPLAEQRRIVDLIGAVDDYIAAAEGEALASATAWRGLADDLIGSKERAELLGEVATVTMGRQRSPKNASGEHMVPYMRAANVKDGKLHLNDVLEMNFSLKEQETFRLQDGDVLVTEGCGSIAQLGASAIWSSEIEGSVCFQNTLLRLRGIDGVSHSRYVSQLARYSHLAGWWAAIAGGTNIFHIGSERAKVMPVPMPPVDQQVEIAGILDDVDDARRNSKGLLDALGNVRATLLSHLLSGAHEVPDSYDELLEAS